MPAIIQLDYHALILLYQVFLFTLKIAIMKTHMKKSLVSMAALIIIATTLIVFGTTCSKSSNDVANADFTGTFCGALVSGSYNEADTIIIPASSTSAIVMNTRTGIGSTYTIYGTISGSTVNITSQPVFISSLNATYQVSGSGALSNANLVINYAFVNASNVTSHWTFTGTRK